MATNETGERRAADEAKDLWQLPRLAEGSLRSKLAICEAAYRAGESLAVAEALTWLFLYLKLPEWTGWIEAAAVDVIADRRTPQQAERHRELMRHLMRYKVVRDLRRRGLTKDAALDRAVVMFAEMQGTVTRDTIEDSYDRVRRDIRDLGITGAQSKYFLLKDQRYLDADGDE
jgi:hypothetical protein